MCSDGFQKLKVKSEIPEMKSIIQKEPQESPAVTKKQFLIQIAVKDWSLFEVD